LHVTTLQSESFRDSSEPFYEAEFFAAGYGGGDITLRAMGKQLSRQVLFTGFHGDKVWDRRIRGSQDIIRGDASGGSLNEFALRIGFVNVAVPFIGCRNHPDISRVSNAPEMAPWTLGSDYDRPIPRRVVETTGVPRSAFGQRKLAVARSYQTTGRSSAPLETIFSEDSLSDFREHLFRHGIVPERYNTRFSSLKGVLTNSHKVYELAKRLRCQEPFERARWYSRKPVTEHNFVSAWAMDKLQSKYRDS
jgi:hypothetical protein